VRRYEEKIAPEDASPNWLQMMSLLCSTLTWVLKQKLVAWAALFLALASFAHMRRAQSDWKQMVASITYDLNTFTLFCIISHCFCVHSSFFFAIAFVEQVRTIGFVHQLFRSTINSPSQNVLVCVEYLY
jgi:hypothetical protein